MKKYSVICALVLTCFTLQAAFELEGVRYGGYITNAVPAGFSILAVPFSGYDTNNFLTTNLSINALISTNGLSSGDQLVVFNEPTAKYCYYELQAGGWVGLTSVEVPGEGLNPVESLPPALNTLKPSRGFAFWLKTANASTAQLQGVVNTNEATVAIASGGFTLVGNALPTSLDLNGAAFNSNTWCTEYVGGSQPFDSIFVANGTNYVRHIYVGGAWLKSPEGTPAAAIPAGLGLWYSRSGDAQPLVLK